MSRQTTIRNKAGRQKIQQFRIKKHRQTLQIIKSRAFSLASPFAHNPQSPKYNQLANNQNRNLQIQRQNIKLFNKIATIIRQKPKVNQSNTYVHTYQQASKKHKKHQQRIKTQNQFLQKRLTQQKATINTKQLFKDRLQNLKYIRLMAKFPHVQSKRSESHLRSTQLHQPTTFAHPSSDLPLDIEVYHKKIDDFVITITKISEDYVFNIKDGTTKLEYSMTMKKDKFDDQFIKCKYSYGKVIGRLRLNKKREVTFKYIKDEQKQQQQYQFQEQEEYQ